MRRARTSSSTLGIGATTKTYLEPGDTAKLEAAATNLRDCLLIRLLAHLGCRIREALNIGVEDIDFANSTIMILHLKTSMKLSCHHCGAAVSGSHSFCPKCGQKVQEAVTKELERRRQRILPVDRKTLAVLKEYIERGGPVLKNGKHLLFPINRHTSWRVVKECAERAGLPKLVNPETGRIHNVSPHKLRDAFAVHAVKVNDSGDGLRMLQEHLGHQSITTTMRYRKVSGDEHKAWYAQLWGEEKDDNPKTET
jgi:integrase/recombinase XerD